MPKLFEFDKIGHLMLYLIFTILVIKSLALRLKENSAIIKIKWLSFFISVAVGGLIEILQANVVQNRHGDVYDFMADIAGAILGFVFYKFIAKKFYKLI